MRSWVWLGIAACGPDVVVGDRDDDVDLAPPVLVVDPGLVNFGGVGRDEAPTTNLTLRNAGGGLLDVEGLAVEGAADFVLAQAPELPLVLGPGEEADLAVRFSPADAGLREAALVATPEAIDGDAVRVALTGLGEVGALAIDPFPVDLGERPVGCVGRATATLRNAGRDVLVLDALDPPASGLSVGGIPGLPARLDEGVSISLTLTATFDAVGPWARDLRVGHDGVSGPDTLPVTATVLPRPPVVETFTVPDTAPVDLLYVVDQSCSMLDQIDLVVEQTGAFTERFAEQRVDGRIAVLTGTEPACFTDVMEPGGEGWLDRLAAALVSVPTVGFTVDGVSYLTEAPLENVARASRYDVPDGCNEGFRRPLAPIHVVVFSDELDQSSSYLTGGPTYWEPWLADVQAWAGPGRLTWHAVVDVDAVCGDEQTPATLGTLGHAEAVAATGGTMLDVCEGAWADDLDLLTGSIAASARRFFLAHQDVETASVRVAVDGAPLATGWSFEASPAAVRLDALPTGGAQVEVRYLRASDCPP